MTYTLPVLLFCLAITQVKDNIMHWSENRKLKVEDFKKVSARHNKSEFSAQTHSGIEPSYDVYGADMNYKVYADFDKNTSWMVEYETDRNDRLDVNKMNATTRSEGLLHEQKHFDITEIYARKIRKMFATRATMKNIDAIDDSIDVYFAQWSDFQNRYDKETNHSLNEDIQLEWNIKIQKMLDSLDGYKKIGGSVKLK